MFKDQKKEKFVRVLNVSKLFSRSRALIHRRRFDESVLDGFALNFLIV